MAESDYKANCKIFVFEIKIFEFYMFSHKMAIF